MPDEAPTAMQPKLRKGDTVKIRIASLASGGEGVSKDMGIPVFVERVAPGDLVEVCLFDVRKDFAKGELVKILEPSAVRAEPPCKLFKVCGGCQWQHINYEGQLDAKADILRQALHHIGKLDGQMVQPTIACADPLFYRNKVQFPAARVKSSGRILAGYYKQNSHELVNIKHCPVQPEPLDRVLEAVKESCERQHLSAYEEKSRSGHLRHIAQRHSRANNKVLLTLVVNSEPDCGLEVREKLRNIAGDIMQIPEVEGVCVNFNPHAGNRIMGDTTVRVAGNAHIVEILRSSLPDAPASLRAGIQYRLSSTSFFQVNSAQAEVLLDQVLLAALGLTGGQATSLSAQAKIPLIVDAYSGVGTMALWLAAIADRVIAIEEWSASVEDGLINRDLNGIENVDFVEGKVEDEIPLLALQNLKADVVVVDPPRKGLHPRALAALIGIGPARIVYVSCNPATLARDLRILEDSGYKTKRIQPVDMFPQTYHVEAVALLER